MNDVQEQIKKDIEDGKLKHFKPKGRFRIPQRGRKQRYYVIFLTKEAGIFKWRKKKRINPLTEYVVSKKGYHLIDASKVGYEKKNKTYLWYNLTSNQQVSLLCFGDDAQMPPDMLRDFIKKNVVKQAFGKLLGTSSGTMLLPYIIGAIGGVGIGWILREVIHV